MDKIPNTLISILLIVITLTSSTNGFDISEILSNASDLGSFNDLLKQTGMDKKINSLQTITVLALDGGACGGLYGKSKDVQQRILSDHVILDYYDMNKIKKLASNKPVTLTTLFQKSGLAHNGQGFLSIIKSSSSSGDVMLGSGVKDAPRNSMVIKQVATKPYNISVLQISQAIIAPGIENIDGSTIPPTSSPDAPSPLSPRKKHNAPPSPSSDDEETVVDDSPAPSPGKAADESSAPAALLALRGTAIAALMGLVLTAL